MKKERIEEKNRSTTETCGNNEALILLNTCTNVLQINFGENAKIYENHNIFSRQCLVP